MKKMIRRICGMCLMLLLAVGVIAAQEGKSVATAPEGKHKPPPTSTPPIAEEVQELRRTQLQMLRENTFSRMVESIKGMEEAALRISARNEILTQLGIDKESGEETKALATQLASDSLTDFSEHGEEIPPLMADYLFNDLAAWIQKHHPKLVERLHEAEKNRKSAKHSDRIGALLRIKGGDAFAAQLIRQLLAEGQEVDGLFFYLDELNRGKSKEFEPLLAQIVEFAGREPQISLETLFWVSEIYLRPDVPVALKRRFLTMIVARTQPVNFVAEPAPQVAYDLLNKVLPFVQELDPELYERGVAQSFNLRASLSETQLATEKRNKRIKESSDPIADLVTEAEAAPSKSERNELLTNAAQMALEQKRFALCLEIVAKLDRSLSIGLPDFWQNWTDQFLKGFVKTALASKDAEQAEKGAERIASPLAHVESLALIVRFRAKANDQNAAERLFGEAIKIADKASDNFERAKAFLLLSLVNDTASESAKRELLDSAMKALNGISRPNTNASNKKPYQQYLQGLNKTGYQLSRGFRELTKTDEANALVLTEKLQKPDMRTFALIGLFQGLSESLAASK